MLRRFGVYELDESVFFLGPLGDWYEKNVPHDGGKFLHCQRAATAGFHNLYLRLRGSPSMPSLLYSINQPSARIFSPLALVVTLQVSFQVHDIQLKLLKSKPYTISVLKYVVHYISDLIRDANTPKLDAL